MEITKEMIKAGSAAWYEKSGWYGPPEVESGPVLEAIYHAMFKASQIESEAESKFSNQSDAI